MFGFEGFGFRVLGFSSFLATRFFDSAYHDAVTAIGQSWPNQ
jgi:hypothetical protein